MFMDYRIALLAAAVLLVSGCTEQPPADNSGTAGIQAEMARAGCIELCREALDSGADLSDGPCLSDNNEQWNIEDWVCDIAHSPRQAIDNEPANQCRAFREGRASHFVELAPDCAFIRSS